MTSAMTSAIETGTVLRVPAFTVVRQGSDYLVGDPASARYVVLPDIGVRVMRMLSAGRTLGDCAAELADEGTDVDVVDFAESLCAVGLAEVASPGELPAAPASAGDSQAGRPGWARLASGPPCGPDRSRWHWPWWRCWRPGRRCSRGSTTSSS